MARQTIIDWQRDNLLVASAQGQGASIAIEKVSEQPIGQVAEGELLPVNGDTAQALCRAVDELELRKTDVIVVASRDIVEVRTLSIPRIDPAELPDVIRFQAQRQLANMGDSWALDYVLLPEEPGQEMLTALVGVISPAVLSEIEAACAEASLQLTNVALRPLEIARYAVNSGKLTTGEVSVVLCVSQQHADLLILNQGRVVQVRSTKLPSEAAQLKSALSGELRRSLMAASPQLNNKPVKSAMLFASSDLATVVQESMSEILGCPIAVVDPVSLLTQNLNRRNELAQTSANRIAGLAGAVNFAAADKQSKLDFKDPKKRPPPKSRRTTFLLTAAAAALLLFGGYFWWSSAHSALDDDLAMYKDQVASQKELTKVAQERIADLREVENFLEGSPNWLDELVYIAKAIPASDKVIVGEPHFTALADGSGQIAFPVAVNNSSTIDDFGESLRDENHIVSPRDQVQLESQPGQLYNWRFNETITVKNRGWKLVGQLETGRAASQMATQPQTAEPKAAKELVPDEDKRASAADDRTDDQAEQSGEA